jgi:trimethylamine:corrinoid methyltransferase-like protein
MIEPIEVLDNNQIERIHFGALQILEKVGMRLRSETHLSYLQEQGFEVDKNNWTVRIPESLVTRYLKKTPKSFKLCSRDGRNDLQMGDRNCYYSTSGVSQIWSTSKVV